MFDAFEKKLYRLARIGFTVFTRTYKEFLCQSKTFREIDCPIAFVPI